MNELSDDPSIVFDPHASEAAKQFVVNGVDNFNIAVTGVAAYCPVAYFVKRGDGEVLGGVLGQIWGGWLHVNYLWVAEPLRKGGYGSRLLEAAEAYARKHGCSGAHLETYSFQARPFYERQGYSVHGELKDYPPGHTKYFLKKVFASR